MSARSHHLHAGCAGASALAAAPFVLKGTERQYERALPFLITHLALQLELEFSQKKLTGVATLSFTRRAPRGTRLELDAVGFEVHRVRVDAGRGWQDAAFTYDGDRLAVSLPARLQAGRVQIDYTAWPRRGLYFLAPDPLVPDRPLQAWTQCQDEDARHWLPCIDSPLMKMSSEIAVRVPNGFTVLSNGELLEARQPMGKAPWRWHFRFTEPHPSYLLTLVAGRFEVVEDRPATLPGAAPVPVRYYVPEGRAADARASLGETPKMLELFGRLTGVPYPWSRYSQVIVSDFIFGGMENTTATTLYEHALLDARALLDTTTTDLVAHELAHQWFGDYVTCRDWSHGWLNEGFATFFEHLEREARLGRDEYDHGLAVDLQSYLGEAQGRYQRPIVCKDFAEPIDLFDRHLYEKGGLVLHMLRRRLTDELFWRGVRLYLQRHAKSVVETRDLQRALEEVSGESLERFFDEWVLRPGHPALDVRVSWEEDALNVMVRQTQPLGDTALFAFLLEVDVLDASGKLRRYTKQIERESDALVVALKQRPRYVVIDPEFTIAGELSLTAPADLLRAQLAEGPSARAKIQAIDGLKRRADVPTLQALGASLAQEQQPWMVRAAAATALGQHRGELALTLLLEHARTKHPKVRRAVVAALGQFQDARAAKALTPLAQKDPSYLVQAEAARSLGATRQPGARATLEKLLSTTSWADVLRAGALDGLGALGDEDALATVTEQTRYGVPTRGRRAAIAALARLGEGRKVRQQLERLLDDADPHLRTDVIAALSSLGDVRARGALQQRLGRETDGRVLRRLREALRDLTDGAASDRKRQQEQLEGLRKDLKDLEQKVLQLAPSRGASPSRRKVTR